MTRSQQLLAHANKCVSNREVTKEYRTVVLGAAAMIQSAGLAQAIAYFQAKASKEDAYRHLLEDIEASPVVGGNLLRRTSSAPSGEYMRLTRLVSQQVIYLKRMAISYYKEKPNA